MSTHERVAFGIGIFFLSTTVILAFVDGYAFKYINNLHDSIDSTCKSATYETTKTAADYVVHLIVTHLDAATKVALWNLIFMFVSAVMFIASPEMFHNDKWFFCIPIYGNGKKFEKYMRFLAATTSVVVSFLLAGMLGTGMFFNSAQSSLEALNISNCAFTSSDFDAARMYPWVIFVFNILTCAVGHAFYMLVDKETKKNDGDVNRF